ncbi:MAG: dipeptidase [Planctomycetota bacterium]
MATFVFDGHVDALQRSLDLGHDLAGRTPGHFDLPRAHAGGVGAVVLTAWIDAPFAATPGASKARAEAILAEGHALAAAAPAACMLVRNGRDLDRARSEGRVGVILGIEGGHALEDDPQNLEHFHGLGVRVLTLTWNNHLPWARSCQAGAGPEVPAGLSDVGRGIVRRMGELGMVVDLSHAGEQTFYDALDVPGPPPIASHSCCRALADHPRNLSDAQLRALAQRGGLLGVTFVTTFLDEVERAAEGVLRAEDGYRDLGALPLTEAMMRRGDWLQARMPAFPLDRVIDHVLHAVDLMGAEHVALGSDFDGIERRPAGLDGADGFPVLEAALAARGVPQADRAAILGGNLERVFRAVTGG